jgi:hypothetical protein
MRVLRGVWAAPLLGLRQRWRSCCIASACAAGRLRIDVPSSARQTAVARREEGPIEPGKRVVGMEFSAWRVAGILGFAPPPPCDTAHAATGLKRAATRNSVAGSVNRSDDRPGLARFMYLCHLARVSQCGRCDILRPCA